MEHDSELSAETERVKAHLRPSLVNQLLPLPVSVPQAPFSSGPCLWFCTGLHLPSRLSSQLIQALGTLTLFFSSSLQSVLKQSLSYFRCSALGIFFGEGLLEGRG